MASFRIEPLAKRHDRRDFDCGVSALNVYLQSQAGQDARRRVTTCFVAIDISTETIAGFYTLAASGIPLGEFSETIIKKLPRYPLIPVVRVGRLAVDRSFQGRKLGEALIVDAIKRCAASDIAAYAIVVDAKDEAAARFYERFDFCRLATASKVLFLPIDEGIKRLTAQ